MKTATGLTLVAIGAILAFAVTAHLRFLDLQVVGWVFILTGLVGIFIPRGGYGWLRKRVVVRRTPRGGPVGPAGGTRPHSRGGSQRPVRAESRPAYRGGRGPGGRHR